MFFSVLLKCANADHYFSQYKNIKNYFSGIYGESIEKEEIHQVGCRGTETCVPRTGLLSLYIIVLPLE